MRSALVTIEPYEVCLFGCSLDTGNRGVSALTVSLVRIITNIQPNARIHLLIGQREPHSHRIVVSGRTITVDTIGFRLSPRSLLRNHLAWILLGALLHRCLPVPWLRSRLLCASSWLRALAAADFVGDIRGGDSFSDIYGLGRMLIGAVPSLTALLMRKKLVLLPQTYGPFRRTGAKRLARLILRSAAAVLSRDHESKNAVTGIVGEASAAKIRFCPDVAFLLEPMRPNGFEAPLVREEDSRPLVGLNVNGLLYNGGYNRRGMFGLKAEYREIVGELIAAFHRRTDARVLLVPHTFGPKGNINSDRDAVEDLFGPLESRYGDRLVCLRNEPDQNGIKGVIGLCDFFIGSRLHACIAAVSQAVPTLALAYSKKFRGVFESVDLDDMVLDARQLGSNAIAKESLRAYGRRAETARRLRGGIGRIEGEVMRVFREILGPQEVHSS